MSSDSLMALAGALFTTLFTAGGFYMYVRMSLKEMREDISGIGNKVAKNEREALKRYHNATIALAFVAPEEKEKDVISLLREFN